MIGKIMQNRYEIIKKIGEGGMATVYKAIDLKLERAVALKILREEYSKDKNFIARFKNEARAYAILSHPNIINVYDIAEDDGAIFLVLEYVEAENLKDYIASKPVLEFNESLKIMRDTSAAIAYAHKKGIIHRDIKPSNVLIDRNGKIKITDFGIARTTQTETVTQGTMLGSVFYFSPEQAQGKEVTPASDIYSLAVLAYQLLTGQLVFEGDNPVTVALKHVKEPPKAPSEVNKALNPDIDACLLKALNKNPLDRYKGVEEFYGDFERALSKILTKKLEDTIIRPAIKIDNDDMAFRKRAEIRKEKKGKKNYAAWFIMLILVIAALYFVMNSLGEKALVPNLVNMTLEDAAREAEGAGFKLKVKEEQFSQTIEAGKIISQLPRFGGKLRINDAIWVIVSKGIEGLAAPNLIGQKIDDAKKIILQMGLKYKIEKEVISKDIPEGTIISQKPAPASALESGGTIYLEVSQGPFAKSVPNFIDLKLEEAQNMLKELGLEYELAGEKPSAKIPKGNIIDQQPKPKKPIPENKLIKLYISSGFENLTAPNLVGLGINEAKQEANELGLDIIILSADNAVSDDAQVVSQNPEPGSAMQNNTVKVKVATTSVVPDIIGKTKEEAEELIKTSGFSVGRIEYLKSSVSKPGTVIEQDPKAGLEVPSGQRIDLIIVK